MFYWVLFILPGSVEFFIRILQFFAIIKIKEVKRVIKRLIKRKQSNIDTDIYKGVIKFQSITLLNCFPKIVTFYPNKTKKRIFSKVSLCGLFEATTA